ncbi:pumilio/PUF RNA binding protein 6 [Trypanosoma equiperdum]|uniref:Pumillio RNA binding protein, putative n=2 Tax=Trypanozoon TaxID=39700 RepID=Q389G5_TRYB2|nr:pumilio RNA-binding protein [Trypanosoma brucei brucei TREU927]EAN78555.1 pumillio RNA binding protein, putative [Trypanosoma brucei brucei TREU927]SCU70720.1 pumilio/PUF RNA binding protein 6 [Trypanosoma equiperdum]
MSSTKEPLHMFSLGVTERSWDDDDGNAQHQQRQQPMPLKIGSEQGGGVYNSNVAQLQAHGRSDFGATGEILGSSSYPSNTPPPGTGSNAMGWVRYTAMDFELLLHEGKQPTDDMRRSQVYAKWYQTKRLTDDRVLPPLTNPRYDAKGDAEAPWDPVVPMRIQGQQSVAGGGGSELVGKGGIRMELDTKNLQQAHEQQTFNPYAMCFQQQDDNIMSPGTQFFGAYAPTPLATMATPNTLRAYAHSRMGTQVRNNNNVNRGEITQIMAPVAGQTLYNSDWNATGDFTAAQGMVPNVCQQYYTQEQMNTFDYYADPTVVNYYNTATTNVTDHTQMQPAIMAIAPTGDMGALRGPAGSAGPMAGPSGGATRGGRRSGGRGRGGNSGKWGSGAARGRGTAPRESTQPCSELLEHFRTDAASGGVSQWRIAHILNHAVEFAQDQEGSRFIQRAVESATHDEVDALFREIFESPLELVVDVFGNYVLQKLLEVGNARQLAYAATRLQNNVVNLTLQTYGCRVIQKCIEVMPPEGLDIILSELRGNVAKCIQDQNGNHVVQKCVEVIPQRCGFIVSAFSGRVMELATHAYGCRVIQCIMDHCPDQEEAIFSELLDCVGTLATDQYGNYVIQHVLQHMKDDEKVGRIFDALKGNFYESSKQKFASNVMEKLFVRADPQQRMELVNMMCSPIGDDSGEPVEVLSFKRSSAPKKENVEKQRNEYAKKGRRDRERDREKENSLGLVVEVQLAGREPPSMLCLMMQNPFANYVAQRVLDAAHVDQYVCLIDNIQKFLLPISTYTYGAPIVQRLVRRELVKAPDDVSLNLAVSAVSAGGRGSYGHHRREAREHFDAE